MNQPTAPCSPIVRFTRLIVVAGFIIIAAARPVPSRADAPSALADGKQPGDKRLGPLKDLNGDFPFLPSASVADWEKRAERVRRQVKVATGLWPMPGRTPANAVIHGKVDRGEYTVERVYLESYPGHFVTGSLYRPKGRTGKLPGVLCPHGHWSNGRFVDQGLALAKKQIVEGAERFVNCGRFPLQARCMQLARMGCVVFHYDMVGYADSQQIPFDVAHRYGDPRPQLEMMEKWGLFSPQAELRLQNIMGLQTYNSIRALDWLCELPDVDPARIGVTGASGGGTQTFMLCAVDSRPAVAFPAVMVSTAMQGGCTCENCDYLRIDTGNVEIAALFAPKPLGMTGANDWTIAITGKGLPELKRLYQLLGAEDNVMAKPLIHFDHNYNYVSRAVMYQWFNRHLKLGLEEPIVEEDFEPLTVAEMTVWDDAHPKPPAGDDYERGLCRYLEESSARRLAALAPKDAVSLAKYREVVGGAVDVMIGHGLPAAGKVEFEKTGEQDRGDYLEFVGLLRDAEHGQELPTLFLQPKQWNKQVVVWIDEAGKAGLYGSDGGLKGEIRKLLAVGASVAGIDLLYQGEFLLAGQGPVKNRKVNTPRQFAGFTYGYNHPLFAQRVDDILSLVSFVKHHEQQPERIDLVGLDGAGAWVAAACAQAGDAVSRAVVDTAGFRFGKLNDFADANFLPGSVKYGDLPGILALVAPRPLWLAGEGPEAPAVVRSAYAAAGQADGLTVFTGGEGGEPTAAAEWLLKYTSRGRQ
ncbi:MAG TPA: acetylxylan esterase [Pirellulales bacterium]|nr:acetylxylan esterase [Pirellulales bacterium]